MTACGGIRLILSAIVDEPSKKRVARAVFNALMNS